MAEKKIPAHEMEVIRKMENLGIYKEEFRGTIRRYVELQKEYKTVHKKYEKTGYMCEVQTAQGVKKSPIVSTLESLRRDILSVEESLGLTPRGLLKLKENAFDKPKGNKTGELI